MPTLRHKLAFLVFFFVACHPVRPDSGNRDDLTIEVRKRAGLVLVDVSMSVPATPQEAWEVLTDYDHMAQFFPNLRSSKVIGSVDNKIRVEQKGKISYGPLSFPFESIREIELKPYSEIRSQAISGSLKKGNATTRLLPDGVTTRIVYHSESIPNVWVPPGIGPQFIQNETGRQFQNLRNEILKRKAQKNS